MGCGASKKYKAAEDAPADAPVSKVDEATVPKKPAPTDPPPAKNDANGDAPAKEDAPAKKDMPAAEASDIAKAGEEVLRAVAQEALGVDVEALPTMVQESATLSESSWSTEYCVFGVLSSKDDEKVMELYKADGRLQVVEEAGAPRLSYLGLPTNTSGPLDDGTVFASFEPPCKPPSQRVYWLAAFDSKECYDTEHKARPSNQAFVPQYMACWANWPEGGLQMPEQMQEVLALAVACQDGQYMGPYWHLEKPGKSVDSTDVFCVVVLVKAKSTEAAQEIINLNKAHGVKQLNSEPGAVRYSIIPPHKTGVEGVGATDMPPCASDNDLTVAFVETFESQEAYALHKEAQHVKDLVAKVKELIDGDIVALEFSNAIHMAKPGSYNEVTNNLLQAGIEGAFELMAGGD